MTNVGLLFDRVASDAEVIVTMMKHLHERGLDLETATRLTTAYIAASAKVVAAG